MKRPVIPLSVPRTIDPDLTRVRTYWESLKRGDAEMPFWDDLSMSSLSELAGRLMLIDVFESPARFRLSFVGQRLTEKYGEAIDGKFVDELKPASPLQYLSSQCSATTEGRAPTYYTHAMSAVERSQSSRSYSRLLLPMWGSRQMLLGAFKWH